MTTLPIVDLFSGAGGLSLGLGRSGLVPVAASEMDADAGETYQAAHRQFFPEVPLAFMEGDIARHSFRSHRGQVMAVVGGPPCQPFSLGGLRRGDDDDRNGLPQFVRVVNEVRPPAFLLENVPGLAKGSLAGHLKNLVRELEALSYVVEYRILQAADFGVAQRRERLVVVGVRSGRFEWPTPTHGEGRSRPHLRVGDILGADPVGVPNLGKVTYAKSPSVRPSPWAGQLFNGGGRPINRDGLAPTMVASMGGKKTPWLDLENQVVSYHAALLRGAPQRIGDVAGARRITSEEAATLQSFPADMPWRGARSSRYRQIGNAVPTKLAEALGDSLRQHLQSVA